MNRLKYKDLEELFTQIAELSNLPANREQAEKNGFPFFLFLEFASAYGGYRLIKVAVNGGAHSGVFGLSSTEPRKPAKEMYEFMKGMLTGLQIRLTDEA